MKKYFYSHLVDIEILETELEDLELSDEEKQELLDLAHKNIHSEVLDVVLSELPGEDKKKFAHLVKEENHEEIWFHLKDRINMAEEKIKQAIEQIKAELREDIKGLKSA